jgi:hypothetical protein
MKLNFFAVLFVVGLFCGFASIAEEAAEEGKVTPTKEAKKAKDSGSTEPWKGPSPEEDFSVGAMAGVGFLNSDPGFTLLGTAAVKILDRGFVGDINDQVFLEVAFGPLIQSTGTDLAYSLHLRWDFHRDDEFALYAIGGLGGVFVTEAIRGDTVIYPRFGIGLLYDVALNVSIRAELSREWMTAGVIFRF